MSIMLLFACWTLNVSVVVVFVLVYVCSWLLSTCVAFEGHWSPSK